jgi:hypothetical protein
MEGALVAGGPIDDFLKMTGKGQADFERELANWNPGAIALFLAEFRFQEAHDSTLMAAVEPVLQESAMDRLREKPTPTAANEAVDFLK